ncbi:MAG: LysR family transcriptional regulator [Deltaproteobacteria bacterium]|nr:LysR family transcriptional regulator [Deltaproteobacteria bacterium]
MYPLVNLHQLRIFTCVAEQKSFAKGASMLGITQPAASIQIKNLEDTLGVKLLDRLGHVIR